jgi:hypothetical protein
MDVRNAYPSAEQEWNCMNPAITVALLAAVEEEEFDKSVVGKLREAKATGPSSAIALELTPDQQELLEEAIANGTISKTADGRLYLDERAIAERQEAQGHVALLIVFVALSIMASGVALFLVATR